MGANKSIIPARAIDDRRLEPAALKVLAALGTYTDRDGYCWPSQLVIAERMGISQPAVARQIKNLQTLGYIAIQRLWDKDARKTHNAYRVIYDAELPEQEDETPQEQPPETPLPEKTDITTSVISQPTDITSEGETDITTSVISQPTDITSEGETDITQSCYRNDPITTQLNTGGTMNADEYKARIAAAIQKGFEQNRGKVDASKYPEEVQKTIMEFCDLWHMDPPRLNGRKNSEAADWIVGAREINDACGEFGLDLLRLYADEFNERKAKNNGLAPYSVNRPASIVKALRGRAAELRASDGTSAASGDRYNIRFDN